MRGCSPPGGTLTAKLLLDGETIATATQYVPVRDPAAEAPAAFQFTPSPLELGASSNVWEVPPGVSSVYLDVTFSSDSLLDNPSRNIKVQLLAPDGTSAQSTREVANENHRGVIAGAGGGSRIRIDVDQDAFDTQAALVTLSFRSGSANGTEIATAKVQTEARPSAPRDGSAIVDDEAGSVTLSWTAGPAVANSRPHHYEIVIGSGEPQYTSGRINGLQHLIQDARSLGLAGAQATLVHHCNAAGGCSLPLPIQYTMLDLVPAPTGLIEEEVDQYTVGLRWNTVTGATRYRVEAYLRGADRRTVVLLDSTVTNYTFAGLECGTSYDFSVTPYGDGSLYVATWGQSSSSLEALPWRVCSARIDHPWRIVYVPPITIQLPQIHVDISANHTWKSTFGPTASFNAFASHRNSALFHNLQAFTNVGQVVTLPHSRTKVYVGDSVDPVFTIENNQWDRSGAYPSNTTWWGGEASFETGPGSPQVLYRADQRAYAEVSSGFFLCKNQNDCTPYGKTLRLDLW